MEMVDSPVTIGNPERLHNERELMMGSGHVGLNIIENTCYLNSVVQCLSHTQALRDYCLNKTYLQEMCSSQEPQLMNEFTKVLEELWCTDKAKKTFTPKSFYNVFVTAVPSFSETRTSKKSDAMWRRYLDTDDSIIVDLFSGQLRSSLCCSVCSHCSITFDVFYNLSLPIPKTSDSGVTLQECLTLFSKEEKISKGNTHMCEKCNHHSEITKRLSIQRFPNILVIHLNRFIACGNLIKKETIPVTFPLTGLKLRSFGAGDCGSVLYDLCALCIHTGTMESGHYIAICQDEGGWYSYDDSHVTQISEVQLQTKEAYLLFYKLKTA